MDSENREAREDDLLHIDNAALVETQLTTLMTEVAKMHASRGRVYTLPRRLACPSGLSMIA